ncbi:cytosine-specific methyltransferase [Halobellus salinus]|uniref:DNA (cytosine-5-)-methyltransferase n=1 Tax=Halobellus salinus TaxID=931585 RepID=A0A830EB45_9EURY|nr:DNA cytosine methyltransferase [Halobellus salinus]GGJ07730.1 cytosine-specific methyltransferase [Halobellus salinus]SMP26490.1 DNA (cytosine-5)-methyltransferase 1 [Halobellus salinus]
MPDADIDRSTVTVLDLFCGGGGLSEGFLQAGYDVVAGVDVSEDFLATHSHNHDDALAIRADLSQVGPEEFFDTHPVDPETIDVVIGGPPCKGFSIAGHRDPDDERNYLVGSFIDYVAFVRPDAFVMENVPGIKSMAGGDTLRSILEGFRQAGYEKPAYETLNAADYGVPQNRRRVIFQGRRDGSLPTYPDRTHGPAEQTTLTGERLKPHVTVGEALAGRDVESLPNHEVTDHSSDIVERIAGVDPGESLYESYGDSWRRLPSDEPAITIKENHNAPFIHPEADRVGTVRECAILQSFPDDYVFQGPKSTQLKVVGNAVPPGLSNAVAEALADDLAAMREAAVADGE